MESSQAPETFLSSCLPGESAVVRAVRASALAPKLTEMGIYLGKPVKVLYRAPFGGPLAVDVGGYTLSMREEEAKLVVVQPLGETP